MNRENADEYVEDTYVLRLKYSYGVVWTGLAWFRIGTR
jgi:hypothetical protein